MEEMNMDKLAMLSQLLGGNSDMGNMMEMAKKAKALSAMMNINKPEAVDSQPIKATADIAEKDDVKKRQINAINAAIPFLDVEYQKGLYMAVKLMEIDKFQPEGEIKAMSNDNTDMEKRKLNMINAIDKCLNNEERKKLGTVLKLAKAGTFLK